MMKMTGRVALCCVGLLIALTSVSAVQRLNSINDLKKINFGQSVPKHSLLLLHWFANTVDIDNNDVIWLPFDPDTRDYGSHYYGNFERLLDPPPQGYRYYTVGNLNQGSSVVLPSYVVHPRRGYEGRNRDRIIFRVRDRNAGQRVDQVYLTQHYETSEHQGTRYDPDHTYRVTTNLLRQIQEFSVEQNQRNSLSELRDDFGSNADDSDLWDIKNTWGDLACLGLLLFIVIQEKHSSNKHNKPKPAARRNTQTDFVCVNIPENRPNYIDTLGILSVLCEDQSEGIELEVQTGTRGNARINWSNIPGHHLKQGVMVVLYDNNEGQNARTYKCIGNRESGTYDTSVPLNDGLQVRLHTVRQQCCFWRGVGEEICRGEEFKNPEALTITGFNAELQLFVKDGKACVRLYVKKSFREWKKVFNKAWVGLYTSANKATNDYEWWQWQWATKFNQCYDFDNYFYDIYEYHSGMVIAPGVQARFILRDNVVKACTPSWQ